MSSNVSKNSCLGKIPRTFREQNAAKVEELFQERNGEIKEFVLLLNDAGPAHGRQRGLKEKEGLFGCVCVIVGFCVVFPFVQSLFPSLRREKSGAQFSLCVFSGVSKALVDVVTLGKESVLPTKMTKAWRVSAPPGVPLLSSCVSLGDLVA